MQEEALHFNGGSGNERLRNDVLRMPKLRKGDPEGRSCSKGSDRMIVYVVRFVNGPSIIVNRNPLGHTYASQARIIEYAENGRYKHGNLVVINPNNVTYVECRDMDVIE